MRFSAKLNNIKHILLPTELALNQDEFIAKVKNIQNFFPANRGNAACFHAEDHHRSGVHKLHH
jgi:hypothetical protein